LQDDGGLVSKFTVMLQLLSDGEWHGIEELQRVSELEETQVQKIASFLDEYDFAMVDTENKQVRIKSHFQDLLNQS